MEVEQKTWKVVTHSDGKGRARFLLLRKATSWISIAVNLYESHLVSVGKSHNTCRNRLMDCSYLYSWAEEVGLDIDKFFLCGRGLEVREIRRFAHWLKHEYTGSQDEPLSAGTVGNILNSCSKFSQYMYEQYFEVESGVDRAAALSLLLERHNADWSSVTPSADVSSEAPDLTDEEIERIEAALHPEGRTDVHPDVAVRNYLMWRLTSKLGLRIGEVLALRLRDCPSGPTVPLRIVRIAERGRDYRDPRTPYAPRPKTLTRDLNLHEDPVLPPLLTRYLSMRQNLAQGSGDRMPGHDFLIVSHSTGQPLSTSAAQRIAAQVAEMSGMDYHWHLSRHAYFNREFEKIADANNYAALRDALQIKGGWSNPKSLDIYTRRVVRERAQGSLKGYQSRLDSMGRGPDPELGR